jgi:ribosomal-protein-alanine N-acetyltransferase
MIPVRLATTRDATEIASMSRDYIESGLGWSWNRPRVVRSVRDPDTTVAVSTRDESISGFAIMVFHEDSAHLNLLAVKPRYRREGIGKYLVRWLEKSARTAGTFKLSLEVRETNLAARTFYQSLGYRDSMKINGYYHNAESAIRMTRNISILNSEGGRFGKTNT